MENTLCRKLPFAKSADVSTADKSGLSMGKRKRCGDAKENLDAAATNIANSQSKETLAESAGTADAVEKAFGF